MECKRTHIQILHLFEQKRFFYRDFVRFVQFALWKPEVNWTSTKTSKSKEFYWIATIIFNEKSIKLFLLRFFPFKWIHPHHSLALQMHKNKTVCEDASLLKIFVFKKRKKNNHVQPWPKINITRHATHYNYCSCACCTLFLFIKQKTQFSELLKYDHSSEWTIKNIPLNLGSGRVSLLKWFYLKFS